MKEYKFISKNPADTLDLAEKISRKLKAGDIIALYGDMGAGKTTFVQGLARSLGYEKKVLSPTFIFVRPYSLPGDKIKTLNHVDLYRVEHPDDLVSIGLPEFLDDENAISVIEWPERLNGKFLENSLKITIKKISESKREFTWFE